MPEQKMTYQERLGILAQKHAESFNDKQEFINERLDYNFFMDEAQVTIAAQAEAIREFNKHVIPDWSEENEPFANEVIDDYLLEYGYTEPKTEEDER